MLVSIDYARHYNNTYFVIRGSCKLLGGFRGPFPHVYDRKRTIGANTKNHRILLVEETLAQEPFRASGTMAEGTW